MVYVKLTILLTVLGNLQRGHSDTTVASASTSYVNSSNEPTVDGSTIQYQTNWTTTDSNGGTTKPVTKNVMTTEASTRNPEAHPQILGKGLKWFLENSTFELFCSYSDASVNVDPVQLRFYDGDNKQLSEDRGFRRTVLSSSSSFVNVSLTKDGIQAEDFGTYVCRYDNTNDSSFIVHVGILKVNITDATYNLLMENKVDYTLTCDVIPAVDTETINSEVTLWFKDGVKAENVSPRHIVNGSTLNIRKAEWSDIGPYTCEYIVLWGSNNSSFQWMVSFNGEARMGSVSVSFNYFQDDDMELSCPVSGYPYPVVTWQRNGVVITPDNRITLSPDASGKYTNAVLNIQSLQFEDKGDYSCTGSSELNTVTSSPIKIRVKDKYAAVWPFIGIVVEVLLLVGIIVVCEKRAKRKKEDTDVVDQPTARRTSERRTSEARQRIISS